MKLTINTDGGARGNPGPGAYGIVIKIEDKVETKLSGFLGTVTNNQAEYLAVLKALEHLKENLDQYAEVKQVDFILDSELVVRQLLKVYKIKSPELFTLYQQIIFLMDSLPYKFTFSHVRRKLNTEADLLVNFELDNRP